MAKNGRPTKYNQKIADAICDAVASESKGLRKLCNENIHWPNKKTILNWLNKYPEFNAHYTRAKQFQIECIVDEILDIADDTSNDTIIKTNANGDEYEVCNNEWINRSRLRVDTRKWLAAKLVPKIYGDQKKEEESKQNTLMEKIIDKL